MRFVGVMGSRLLLALLVLLFSFYAEMTQAAEPGCENLAFSQGRLIGFTPEFSGRGLKIKDKTYSYRYQSRKNQIEFTELQTKKKRIVKLPKTSLSFRLIAAGDRTSALLFIKTGTGGPHVRTGALYFIDHRKWKFKRKVKLTFAGDPGGGVGGTRTKSQPPRHFDLAFSNEEYALTVVNNRRLNFFRFNEKGKRLAKPINFPASSSGKPSLAWNEDSKSWYFLKKTLQKESIEIMRPLKNSTQFESFEVVPSPRKLRGNISFHLVGRMIWRDKRFHVPMRPRRILRIDPKTRISERTYCPKK